MKEKKIKDKILFAIISVFLFASIVIIFSPVIFNNLKNESFYITSSEPITNNVIQVQELAFFPGFNKTSEILLQCKKEGNYLIKLDFKEKEEGILKDYLFVIIKHDDQIIFEDTLNVVFSYDDIYIKDKFNYNDIVNFEIIYILPEEVGNEVEGANTKFDIKLIIKQE